MGRWEIQSGISEEVGKKLEKMEISFSGGETLKGDNVKIAESELSFVSFYFLFSYFLFYLILPLFYF